MTNFPGYLGNCVPKEVSKPARTPAIASNRPGEGVLIDMQVSPITDVGGFSVAQLSGNFSTLPVPDRHYTADICDVQYRQETVYVLFGQERFGRESGLRNLVVIRMNPAAIATYLQSRAGNGVDLTIDVMAQKLGITADSLTTVEAEPKETVTLTANVIMSASSGRESCMDFFYASPFSKAAATHTHKLALDPVVRVDLRTSLILGLHKKLEALIADLPETIVSDTPGRS